MTRLLCPTCERELCIILTPLDSFSTRPVFFLFGPPKLIRHRHGYLVRCFGCDHVFRVTEHGAIIGKAKKPEAPAPGRDPETVRATERAYRSRGPLLPAEPPPT